MGGKNEGFENGIFTISSRCWIQSIPHTRLDEINMADRHMVSFSATNAFSFGRAKTIQKRKNRGVKRKSPFSKSGFVLKGPEKICSGRCLHSPH